MAVSVPVWLPGFYTDHPLFTGCHFSAKSLLSLCLTENNWRILNCHFGDNHKGDTLHFFLGGGGALSPYL